MKTLEGAGHRLSAILCGLAALSLASAPAFGQALVTPNPSITSLPGPAAFTGQEWLNFRQDRANVTAPVATVIGQATTAATAATAPAGTELIPCVQAAALKNCTVDQIGGRANSRVAAVRSISTGTTDTATTSDTDVIWKSPTAGAKTETIPACSSSITGQILHIKDGQGTAASGAIAVTPSSGTIDGASSVSISTNRGNVEIHCNGTATNWEIM